MKEQASERANDRAPLELGGSTTAAFYAGSLYFQEAIKIKIVAFTRLTEDFSQAAYRRAGLYGLSAVGVALYQRNVSWCASYSFVETNVVLGAAHLPNRKLV